MYTVNDLLISAAKTSLQPSDEANNSNLFSSFAIAIAVLASASVIVQLLMHWFVAGV